MFEPSQRIRNDSRKRWRSSRGTIGDRVASGISPPWTGTRGCSRDGKVEMQRDMHQDERRSSLSHELVHDERRIYPTDPVLRAKEEITVERIAARRLIKLGRLVDVLCGTGMRTRWPRNSGSTCQCWSL